MATVDALAGKKIAIVGASSDLGADLIEVLQGAGARLALIARDVSRVTPDASHKVISTDGSFGSVVSSIEQSASELGGLDGLVCLAGSLLLKPAHLTTEGDFQMLVSTHLIPAFATVAAAGKVMRQSGGRVVLVSSAAARIGLANHEGIAMVKSGIEGLVRSAATTYAKSQICFNAVAPGLTRTRLTQRITSSEASLKASTAMHPMGRIGEPRDVVEAIGFLLGREGFWISGQVLAVDGGLSTMKAL